MPSFNICLAPDCSELTSDVFCCGHDMAHEMEIALQRRDVFQRAVSGYHTLTHCGFTARNLGTGKTTSDDWDGFVAWNPFVEDRAWLRANSI